jgi:hypothetical protein
MRRVAEAVRLGGDGEAVERAAEIRPVVAM